jgi:hypothetical protein
MKNRKTSFCSSNFPWARERNFSKFIENVGTCHHKFSPALSCKPSDEVSRPYTLLFPARTACLTTAVALNLITLKIRQNRPGTVRERKIRALSLNPCCSGNTISITYCQCVFVALFI